MTDIPAAIDGTAVLPIVRVAILSDGRIVDIALPTHLPVREIVPAIRRLLPPAGDEGGVAVPRPLSLAPVGGAAFSLDANLDAVGVVDGDLLALQPVPAGPPAPGVIEDVADAAVIFSAARQRPWGIDHVRRMARAAVVVVILAATGLATAHRVSTGEVAGLYAASALAASTVIAALLARARAGRWAAELSVAALVPIAAALALAVGEHPSAAQLMLAAAGVTAWSLICMITADRCVAFFVGAAVVGAAILVAAAVAQLWQLPLVTLGCGLLTAALLVTVQAPALSVLTARLPMPVIPAPGDPAPLPPATRVLEDLPRRVQVGEAHQSGFIAGAVVLSVLGALAVTHRPDAAGGWGWYVVIAFSVAAVLRARIWDSAACKTWLLAQPVLVSVGLLAAFVVGGHYRPALYVLAVLAGVTATYVALSANPDRAKPENYSLPTRRLVGLLAATVDASLLPALAYLVGLFAWVLDR